MLMHSIQLVRRDPRRTFSTTCNTQKSSIMNMDRIGVEKQVSDSSATAKNAAVCSFYAVAAFLAPAASTDTDLPFLRASPNLSILHHSLLFLF